jgi:hypothetical protein
MARVGSRWCAARFHIWQIGGVCAAWFEFCVCASSFYVLSCVIVLQHLKILSSSHEALHKQPLCTAAVLSLDLERNNSERVVENGRE